MRQAAARGGCGRVRPWEPSTSSVFRITSKYHFEVIGSVLEVIGRHEKAGSGLRTCEPGTSSVLGITSKYYFEVIGSVLEVIGRHEKAGSGWGRLRPWAPITSSVLRIT